MTYFSGHVHLNKAVNISVPMATHSFPVPTHLISICKMRPQTRANIFICLLDHAYETICKYENGMSKVARNAFNIGEA